MHYVEKHLRINEQILAKAQVSWTVYAWAVIRALIFMLLIYAVWTGLNWSGEVDPAALEGILPAEIYPSVAEIGSMTVTLKQPDLMTYLIGWGIITLIWLFYRILSISAIELAVTDKKIVGKKGILRSTSVDAYLEKIDHFTIRESILGRIFNFATIEIGTTSSKITFPYISYASDFRNAVMDYIDDKKQKDMQMLALIEANEARYRNN